MLSGFITHFILGLNIGNNKFLLLVMNVFYSVYSYTFELLHVYHINFLYCFINYIVAATCYNVFVFLERSLLCSDPSVHVFFV